MNNFRQVNLFLPLASTLNVVFRDLERVGLRQELRQISSAFLLARFMEHEMQ